jgi:hypothetical protein
VEGREEEGRKGKKGREYGRKEGRKEGREGGREGGRYLAGVDASDE